MNSRSRALAVALTGSLIMLAAGIGALGALASFDKVSAMAAARHASHPWLIPLAVDLGIVAFNLGHLYSIFFRRNVRWLRWFAIVLIFGTAALNALGEPDAFGVLSHVLPPVIYAAIVEAASALITRGEHRPTRAIPARRWLHAPCETFMVWRTKANEPGAVDYPTALRMHRTRRLVRAELTATHSSWRKVPADKRYRYRIHALEPAEPLPAPTELSPPGGRRPVTRTPSGTRRPSTAPVTGTSAPEPPAPSPVTPPPSPVTTGQWWPATTTEADWLAAGTAAHDALTAAGQPFNRDTVTPELKARGVPSGKNDQRAELVRRVKALHTVTTGRNGSTPPAVTTT